ncbi:S-adenosylmethionine decarboxylase [Dactylosporangium sp. NPDC005572]|uniref:S-adenosylmethionine decarboxylase n=1 Tax=Dactylosporangium sp. NPDC005572 TaxID=3156889 RepID=UPI0033B5DDED
MVERFALDNPAAAGYSLVQLITTSSITAHFAEHTGRAFINVFSCKPFDAVVATDFIVRYFRARRCTQQVLHRGAPWPASPAGSAARTGAGGVGGVGGGGVQPRQFPAWLDRSGPRDLVAEAQRRWPWSVHHGGGPGRLRLVVGDAHLADVLDLPVGHVVDDADDYCTVWRESARLYRPTGSAPLIRSALVRLARRPGSLIVQLDPAAVNAVLDAAQVRPSTLRAHLNWLDRDGLLGRIGTTGASRGSGRARARVTSGGWGCYALTMPLPPLAGSTGETPGALNGNTTR